MQLLSGPMLCYLRVSDDRGVMNMLAKRLTTLLLMLAGIGLMTVATASTASAQATRTWVSGVGDDANPCSRTAPCKTFAGAISKTAAGGEISVLDPGGFGGVTITKSISIVADGSEGSILVSGTNGIIISAGANDQVTIHGIKIEALGTGLNGVRILRAGEVYLSHMFIRGARGTPGCGINVSPSDAPTRVYVTETELVGNDIGVCVTAPNAAQAAAVALDDVVIENNLTNTVTVDGPNAGLVLHNSRLNQSAMSITNGGFVNSRGNNFIAGAVGPTSTVPLR